MNVFFSNSRWLYLTKTDTILKSPILYFVISFSNEFIFLVVKFGLIFSRKMLYQSDTQEFLDLT